MAAYSRNTTAMSKYIIWIKTLQRETAGSSANATDRQSTVEATVVMITTSSHSSPMTVAALTGLSLAMVTPSSTRLPVPSRNSSGIIRRSPRKGTTAETTPTSLTTKLMRRGWTLQAPTTLKIRHRTPIREPQGIRMKAARAKRVQTQPMPRSGASEQLPKSLVALSIDLN